MSRSDIHWNDHELVNTRVRVRTDIAGQTCWFCLINSSRPIQRLRLYWVILNAIFSAAPSRPKVKGKGKGHALDIVVLTEEISLQKWSAMAHVVEGFHSSSCTPTRLSAGMEGWVGLGATTVSKQFDKTATWQLSQLLAAQVVTPHWATGTRGASNSRPPGPQIGFLSDWDPYAVISLEAVAYS